MKRIISLALYGTISLVVSATPIHAQISGWVAAGMAGPPGYAVVPGFVPPQVHPFVPFGPLPGVLPVQPPLVITNVPQPHLPNVPYGYGPYGYGYGAPSPVIVPYGPCIHEALHPYGVPHTHAYGNTVIVPGAYTVPGPVAGPRQPRVTNVITAGPVIVIGAPRADVFTRLGRPNVTLVTRTGETLFYQNRTIIIENGRVVVIR